MKGNFCQDGKKEDKRFFFSLSKKIVQALIHMEGKNHCILSYQTYFPIILFPFITPEYLESKAWSRLSFIKKKNIPEGCFA